MESVIGQVRGLKPIVVDDMITTAAIITAAAKALLARRCASEITAVTMHAFLVAPAVERTAGIGLKRLVVSDSLPARKGLPFACEVVGLSRLLADAVRQACQA